MQDAQGGGIAYLPADATAGETPQRSVPGREEEHALHVRTGSEVEIFAKQQAPCHHRYQYFAREGLVAAKWTIGKRLGRMNWFPIV